MKWFILLTSLISVVLICVTACDPVFTDYVCKDGQVLLVPPDNHSGSEWMAKGKAICVQKLPGSSSEYTGYTLGVGCSYFNSSEACHYKDCPDCVVLQCNQYDEMVLTDVSCYDYYMDRENGNTLLPDL